jgi:hypothetical protein
VIKVCLGTAPRCLGGPFIAPRDLGAIGASFESSEPSLSSGAPDFPVVHQTLHNTTVKRSLIGHFPSHMGTGLFGAPSNFWLLADVADSHWLISHQTVWRSAWTIR